MSRVLTSGRCVPVRNTIDSSLLLNSRWRQFPPTQRQEHSITRELQVSDLLDVYRGLVLQGRLKYDEDQVRAVMELRRLQKRLTNYVPPGYISSVTSSKTIQNKLEDPWWSHNTEIQQAASELKSLVRLKSHADEIATLDTPKGLFLTGHPGSGKSMLVDLWFSIIPTPYKVRKHYSTLILEIYRGVWDETKRRQALLSRSPRSMPQASWSKAVRDRWRALLASGNFPSLRGLNEILHSVPMPSIAYNIARRLLLSHWLLVFDEVQLLDVSSAGLLSDVLFWFWRMGGVVVGTSNKVPDDLYRNGVQKERLEPFVEALKLRCPVLDLRGTVDYRKMKVGHGQKNTWFTHGQEKEFEAAVHRMCQGKEAVFRSIEIFGRVLPVREISDTACQFGFEELCDRSLGSADYISIASRYSTVVLTDVPVFRSNAKNKGRRFISLIDALYESRCRLICFSESALDGLFFPDAASPETIESNEVLMMAESVSETSVSFRPNVSSYHLSLPPDSNQLVPLNLGTLSIFSGEEERFAYQRAYSRLREMTTLAYQKESEWTPVPVESRSWETSSIGAKEDEMGSEATMSLNDATLAAAAAYSRTETYQVRPPAPRFGEDHIWGVREDWGLRAKAWGKGAANYNDTDGSGKARK